MSTVFNIWNYFTRKVFMYNFLHYSNKNFTTKFYHSLRDLQVSAIIRIWIKTYISYSIKNSDFIIVGHRYSWSVSYFKNTFSDLFTKKLVSNSSPNAPVNFLIPTITAIAYDSTGITLRLNKFAKRFYLQ